MVPLKFSSSRQSAIRNPQFSDPLHLQPALADRPDFFPAAVFGENVSPRRISGKIRPTLWNLRAATARALVLEENDLAARGERWRGDNRAQACKANQCS